MSKTDKKPLVPKLRFPEFLDQGDWNRIKLIDTANKKKKWSFIGGPFGSNLKSSDYTNTGIRIIQLQNIGDAEFKDTYKIFTSKKKADELLSCNIYPGEIILSKMGDPVGRACLIPDNHPRYVMCSDGIRLVVDERAFSKYYIYSYINSDQFRLKIKNNSTGSTRKRIGLDVLRNLKMIVPRKPEQQKIADCLASIDDFIATEEKKLEAYKDHKKGLLQKLFPVEGETIPEWRFPNFRGKQKWDKTTFDNLFTIGNGRDYKQLSSGDIPVYGSGGYMLSVNDYLYDGESVCIGRKGTIDKPIFLSGKFWTVDTLFYTHSFVNCLPKFIFLLFQNINWLAHNEAGGIPSLSKANINKIMVAIPSKPEQEKITDFFLSLDNLITTQSQKIEALNVHKKGLMQRLVPSAEEVGV
jgi:type I restriction enzyme, S subunit